MPSPNAAYMTTLVSAMGYHTIDSVLIFIIIMIEVYETWQFMDPGENSFVWSEKAL